MAFAHEDDELLGLGLDLDDDPNSLSPSKSLGAKSIVNDFFS